MSQQDVLQLLKKMGGRASSSEIIQEAKKEFPERSLYSHVSMRLNDLERRNLVSKQDTGDGLVWETTTLGNNTELNKYVLSESLTDECISILSEQGIDIVNVVAVIDTEKEINIFDMDMNLSNVDYHPETDSHLSYYPEGCDNVTLRIPSSGRITAAGCGSKEELIESLNSLSSNLEKIGYILDPSEYQIEIQNIVGTTKINKELDLDQINSEFESDSVEYNPENFPSLIFRPQTTGTVMIFRTGAINLTGVKNCDQLLALYKRALQEIPGLGKEQI